MTKKGLFSAAIKVLEEYDLFAASRSIRKSCHLAIPILKAAGKVDKNRMIKAIEDAIENGESWQGSDEYMAGLIDFRILAEALPDKEEK